MLSTCNIIYAQGIMDLWNKYQINKYMEYAEEMFIEEGEYMSERDALSKEIDYYKPPYVYKKEHIRKLTGKDLIHICNIIEKVNEKKRMSLLRGEIFIVNIEMVEDVKNYALDHPNDYIANEFYFKGTFTTYNKDTKYSDRQEYIIVIPELKNRRGKYRYLSGKF